MKRGIILEQHRNYTILLTKDGAFEKGKLLDKDGQIGEEVIFETIEPKKKSLILSKDTGNHVSARLLSIACVLILLILPFYLISGADKTYAYVSVDINPSIELEIDDDYMVQTIRPMNSDSSNLIEQLGDYQKEKLETVIQMIMDKSEETGQINQDKNLLIGVSFLDDANKEKQEILDEWEKHFQLRKPEWNIAAFSVPENIREMALEQQTSMNEVMAATYVKDVSVSEKESVNINNLDAREIEIIDSFYYTEQGIDEVKKQESDTEETNEVKEPEETMDELDEESSKEIPDSQYDAEEEKEKENAPVIMSNDTKEQKDNSNENGGNSKKNEIHPSELKSKNGEINSNGKNIEKKNNNSRQEKKQSQKGKDKKVKDNANNKDQKKDNRDNSKGRNN